MTIKFQVFSFKSQAAALLGLLLLLALAWPAGAVQFGHPPGGGSAVITTNEFDASAVVSGTFNSARIPAITTNKIDSTFYDWVDSSAGGVSAAQVAAIMATNGAAGATNVYGIGARHVNARDYFHLWTTMQSNLPVRFLIIGDSVADFNETTRGVRYALDTYMVRGGYGSFYTEEFSSEGIIFAQSGISVTKNDLTLSPAAFYGFTNGAALTTIANGGGITADTLQLYPFLGGAGSFLIETQRNGGSFGTLATVNVSSGSGMLATNFTLNPKTNYNVRITSTGSNNLFNVALLDNTATNSHAWARIATPGGTTEDIVTNAGFYTFLTNYNPQVIFVEAQDTVNTMSNAMRWLTINCTNRDIVYITASPSPVGGTDAQREFMLSYAQTNNLNVFDKFGLFLPTNYWFQLMPLSTANIYQDGSHLGYKGIQYISSAFSSWFGDQSPRFGMAGLRPTAGSDGAKANLAGGNTFSGAQVVSSGNVTMQSGTLDITGEAVTRGASGAFTFIGRDGTGNMKIYSPVGGALTIRDQSDGFDALTFTNVAGTRYLHPITAGVPMNLGRNEVNKWWWNIWVTNVVATSLTVTGTTTLADLNVTGRATVQNLAQPTNTWAINTAIGMGTNAYYTGGAQTLGVTGVADNPTNAIYFGELEIAPTGDIIFTNPVSFKASDYAITRTFTNGNSVLVAVRVKPGVSTNLSFVQFR
jgi:hypothetical protein